MIELTGIEKSFRNGDVETSALRQIDLFVDRGEFLAVMGPSGCGKSTLLSVLGTLDRPSAGRYALAGEDLSGMSERQLTEVRRKHIGFVFQSFNLIDELTIRENVELALAYRDRSGPDARARADRAMEEVGIAHRARHYPSQLSGGQQQRAAVARAIVARPDLILADEPTGNLDTENGDQVMSLLRALNEAGTTIVMVTHSPAHADWAGRRVQMLDGRIIGVSATIRALAS